MNYIPVGQIVPFLRSVTLSGERLTEADLAEIQHALDADDGLRVCPDCGLTAARIGEIHINAQATVRAAEVTA